MQQLYQEAKIDHKKTLQMQQIQNGKQNRKQLQSVRVRALLQLLSVVNTSELYLQQEPKLPTTTKKNIDIAST